MLGGNGEAFFAVVGGGNLVINNSNNANVLSWQLDLLYADPASALVAGDDFAHNNNSAVVAATALVDVPGGCRWRLKVWSNLNRVGAPDDVDIRVSGVKEANGLFAPPPQIWPRPLPPVQSGEAGAKPNELNFGGQPDGWAGDGSTDGLMNQAVREIGGGGSSTAAASLLVKHVDILTTVPPGDQTGTVDAPFSDMQVAADALLADLIAHPGTFEGQLRVAPAYDSHNPISLLGWEVELAVGRTYSLSIVADVVHKFLGGQYFANNETDYQFGAGDPTVRIDGITDVGLTYLRLVGVSVASITYLEDLVNTSGGYIYLYRLLIEDCVVAYIIAPGEAKLVGSVDVRTLNYPSDFQGKLLTVVNAMGATEASYTISDPVDGNDLAAKLALATNLTVTMDPSTGFLHITGPSGGPTSPAYVSIRQRFSAPDLSGLLGITGTASAGAPSVEGSGHIRQGGSGVWNVQDMRLVTEERTFDLALENANSDTNTSVLHPSQHFSFSGIVYASGSVTSKRAFYQELWCLGTYTGENDAAWIRYAEDSQYPAALYLTGCRTKPVYAGYEPLKALNSITAKGLNGGNATQCFSEGTLILDTADLVGGPIAPYYLYVRLAAAAVNSFTALLFFRKAIADGTAPTIGTPVSTVFDASSTSHLVEMPAAVLAGDQLVVLLALADDTVTITPPVGWTEFMAGGSAGLFSGIYLKTAAGNEDGTTLDFVSSSAAVGVAQAYAVTAGVSSAVEGTSNGFGPIDWAFALANARPTYNVAYATLGLVAINDETAVVSAIGTPNSSSAAYDANGVPGVVLASTASSTALFAPSLRTWVPQLALDKLADGELITTSAGDLTSVDPATLSVLHAQTADGIAIRTGRFPLECWTNNETDFWRTISGWGGGSTTVDLAVADHPGALLFTTPSGTGSGGGQVAGPGNMLLSVGMRLEFEFRTPTVFVGASSNLMGHLGFGGNKTTVNSFVRGVYARYEGDGDLKAYVSNVDSGNVGTLIATLSVDTWYQLSVEITPSGGDFVLYDSSGVEIASLSKAGTVPTTTTGTSPGASAGRTATDASLLSYTSMILDYAAFIMPNLGRRIHIGG